MGWADNIIHNLKEKNSVRFRPHGNSMKPLISSGDLCEVLALYSNLNVGDIVLSTVKGRQYVHLIKAVRKNGDKIEYLIGNNRGGINGWTSRIHGLVFNVEKDTLKT